MKDNIHPVYEAVAVTCSCGNKFETKSTLAKPLPVDVWVETIPFDETRQYVQNVLSYSVIYGQKLNAPQPMVEWHERFFDDQ